LHVTGVTPGHVQPFNEVKDDLRKELSTTLVAEALYDRANQADDVIASGASIEEVANAFNLTPATFENISAEGKTAVGKEPQDTPAEFERIVAQAFQLERNGQVGQLVETKDNAFLIVGLTGITPPQQKPLDDVRKDVVSAWKEQ